ncbi:hypothetical protein AALO_G00211540 [Alosa alosa]|uniref:Secreted protein n=1 Tax=Alosa alosa TaxID=278164 RepID=A0AAV6FZT5_9TELE|nr:hypothetical protein AALO_G00211540 [Alosa alosa]
MQLLHPLICRLHGHMLSLITARSSGVCLVLQVFLWLSPAFTPAERASQNEKRTTTLCAAVTLRSLWTSGAVVTHVCGDKAVLGTQDLSGTQDFFGGLWGP